MIALATQIRSYQTAIIRNPMLLFLFFVTVRRLPAHHANWLISSRLDEMVDHVHVQRQWINKDISSMFAFPARFSGPDPLRTLLTTLDHDTPTTIPSQPSPSPPKVPIATRQHDKFMPLAESGASIQLQSNHADARSMFTFLARPSSPNSLRTLLTNLDNDAVATMLVGSSSSNPNLVDAAAPPRTKFLPLAKPTVARGVGFPQDYIKRVRTSVMSNITQKPSSQRQAISSGQFLPTSISPAVTNSPQENTRRSQPLSISISPGEYIIGASTPTITGVIFSIPWRLIFTAIQDIEPFHQLSNSNGALAEDSLTLEYRASTGLVTTFVAVQKGHFLV